MNTNADPEHAPEQFMQALPPFAQGGRFFASDEQRLAFIWSRIVIAPNGCWVWRGPVDTPGYPNMKFSGKSKRLSHFIWHVFYGQWPDATMQICHRCDTPRCLNPAHLFIGTHKDNMLDMVAKGRHRGPHGEEVNTSVLTEADVQSIRTGELAHTPTRDLTRRFGVDMRTIQRIRKGTAWKHLLTS